MAPPSSWSDLGEDILGEIFIRLKDPSDVLRSAQVCSSWRPVANEIYATRCLPKLLMVGDPRNPSVNLTDLHAIGSRNPALRVRRLYPPGLDSGWRVCVNSTNGWLLTVDNDAWGAQCLHLENPVSRTQIPLPSLFACGDFRLALSLCHFAYVRKGITSTSPLEPGCFVLLMVLGCPERSSKGLFFWKIGDDQVWKELTVIESSETVLFLDIVHYKGQFYAVDDGGRIFLCELNNSNPTASKIMPNLAWSSIDYMSRDFFFVESLSGDLLCVVCGLEELALALSEATFALPMVEVYKLDLFSQVKWWRRVGALGEQSLFISRDISQSVPTAVPLPHLGKWFRGNCIYYLADTFDRMEGCPPRFYSPGLCMYDLETNQLSVVFDCDTPFTGCRKSHQLLWFVPDN